MQYRLVKWAIVLKREEKDAGLSRYTIIDGQQRLTTITLLLLAIRNLIVQRKVATNEGKLDEQISQRFLISPWAGKNERKFR